MQGKLGHTMTLLGIVTQLYNSRMNQLLAKHDLNLSQLSLMFHMIRAQQKQHTISELTVALELKQPGVSKIVKKLELQDLLVVEKAQGDSRKRVVSITDAGRLKIQNVMTDLQPDVIAWFEGWSESDVDVLNNQLGRLVAWLDENRLP